MSSTNVLERPFKLFQKSAETDATALLNNTWEELIESNNEPLSPAAEKYSKDNPAIIPVIGRDALMLVS